MEKKDFKKINNYLWEIPSSFRPDMRVPARFYLSEKMLTEIFQDKSLEQLINVTTLPGIQKYALAMPDMHEGYASPIGGVAAIDIKEGIISPGMQGYDINCLSPKTKVLLEHGTSISIEELAKIWPKKKVKFVDFNSQDLSLSEIILFLKRYNNPTIYKILTKDGETIEATGDHPFQTKAGMKETKLLKEGEYVLIYPFKGVEFTQPSGEVILTEENFTETLKKLGKTNKGSAISQILKEIKKLSLISLKYDSWQLPYLLKIMGFIFGDGYISISKNKRAIVGFNGKPEDLKEIQKDIEKIGFHPSPIFKRKRSHRIRTHYREYEFESTEYYFRVSSFAFAGLLISLGTPFGKKVLGEYQIPQWIFKCELWQKRLFLAALFGAELSKPKAVNKYNFYTPQLNLKKAKFLKENLKLLLKDIAKLLKEFGVKVTLPVEVPGYKYEGKAGETTGFRLQIKGETKNLIRFFELINYEYNKEKHKEACLAANYLKKKLKVAKLRKEARKEIKGLYRKKGDFKKFAPLLIKKYDSQYVTLSFLYHSLFKERSHGKIKERGNPRIAFNFLSFEEYKKQYVFGEKGLVWGEIEKIEKISYKNFVYDFTIKNNNHNFVANGFVVSNCGVRILTSQWTEKDLKPHLEKLTNEIYQEVPSGLGRGRQLKFSIEQLDHLMEGGVPYLVEKGYGEQEDIENCEDQGKLVWAEAKAVSRRAKERGRDQVGTLGSGNHFLEIQKVAEIFDDIAAKAFGLFLNQIVVMIHCGSRGLGHQVCSDYLKEFIPLMINKYKIKVPDREFACVPFNSSEGQRALAASGAAANYAWANRQMITYFVRKAWRTVLGDKNSSLNLLYDVAHNIIKKEKYQINGHEIEVAMHRKGATRAFPAHHPEIPEKYRTVGQPVIIPGSMGTASYILKGLASGEQSFFSTCHGAGRTMSRHAALRTITGQEVINQLKSKGIMIRCQSFRGIAEEAPLAYKDIESVVEVVHQAGLSQKVVRLVPLAVIKGE
ncbi:MAG: RtcB family protein [Minisyncoccales bacterium]